MDKVTVAKARDMGTSGFSRSYMGELIKKMEILDSLNKALDAAHAKGRLMVMGRTLRIGRRFKLDFGGMVAVATILEPSAVVMCNIAFELHEFSTDTYEGLVFQRYAEAARSIAEKLQRDAADDK